MMQSDFTSAAIHGIELDDDTPRSARTPRRVSGTHCSQCLRQRTACQRFCCHAFLSGTVSMLAFTIIVLALNDSLLWTRAGASQVLPAVVIPVILITTAATDAYVQSKDGVKDTMTHASRQQAESSRHSFVYCCAHPASQCVRRLGCGVAACMLLFVLGVWCTRASNVEHLDDLHPAAACPFLGEYLSHPRATFLWLIPIHDGVPMSSNATWCNEMARLARDEGKVLGMHGVYHEQRSDGMREFESLSLDDARVLLDQGVAEWRRAFRNATPAHFSFPGQWGSPEVAALLRDEYGMTPRSFVDGLLQRIYHCDDSWCSVGCKSWFNDFF
jgi:hypothetical protein